MGTAFKVMTKGNNFEMLYSLTAPPFAALIG